MQFVWVMVGGAVGSALRHALGMWADARFGAPPLTFPWGTFAVNVLGSFLLGAVFVLGEEKNLLTPDVRLLLGTGLLGGFTTYSTFNLQVLRFGAVGDFRSAVLYAAGTAVVCLIAGVAGMACVRLVG